MLILQRKQNQALLIGDDIKILVLEASGGGVRLGIEAPAHVSIFREELVEQVRSENLRASLSVKDEVLGPLGAPSPST